MAEEEMEQTENLETTENTDESASVIQIQPNYIRKL